MAGGKPSSSGLGPGAVLAAAVLCLALGAGRPCGADQEATLSALYGAAYFKVDPHWKSGKCKACHAQKAEPQALYLRGDGITTCTICHDRGKAAEERHPVGVKAAEKTAIPEGFPLSPEKRITCLSCHDHRPVCYLEGAKKGSRLFLRGGPYERVIDSCFRCHEKDEAKGFDPHSQQIRDGRIVETRCLFCHDKVLERAVKPEPGEVHLRTRVSLVCIGCHLLTPHAGAVEHLVKPRKATLAIMEASEKREGVVFPLDEKGRMTCITCHNSHERGVLPETAPEGRTYVENDVPAAVKEKWRELGPTVRRDMEDALSKIKDADMTMIRLEPRPEKNIRLSAREGRLCLACHPEGTTR